MPNVVSIILTTRTPFRFSTCCLLAMEDKTGKCAAAGDILSYFNKRSRVQKNCPITWPCAASRVNKHLCLMLMSRLLEMPFPSS